MSIPTYIDPETLPDHDIERFTNFYEIQLDGRPAFQLQDGSTFFLDTNNGWNDENNCYYNSQGEALGWFKIFNGKTYFYNNEGFFVPYRKDPDSLPKHSEKVNVTKLDSEYNFVDQNGCYYDQFGDPLGWKLQCEDGQLYFFDLNGDYVDINTEEQESDLLEFDLGDFKQDFKYKAQFIKQSQKPYPKEEPKGMIKKSIQQQPQRQSPQHQKIPKPIQKPKQVQQVQQQQNNQKAIYHFELPDATDETKKMFVALVKSKLQNKPEFVLNAQLLTVKCDEQNKQLEQDFQLENGKCVKFKK